MKDLEQQLLDGEASPPASPRHDRESSFGVGGEDNKHSGRNPDALLPPEVEGSGNLVLDIKGELKGDLDLDSVEMGGGDFKKSEPSKGKYPHLIKALTDSWINPPTPRKPKEYAAFLAAKEEIKALEMDEKIKLYFEACNVLDSEDNEDIEEQLRIAHDERAKENKQSGICGGYLKSIWNTITSPVGAALLVSGLVATGIYSTVKLVEAVDNSLPLVVLSGNETEDFEDIKDTLNQLINFVYSELPAALGLCGSVLGVLFVTLQSYITSYCIKKPLEQQDQKLIASQEYTEAKYRATKDCLFVLAEAHLNRQDHQVSAPQPVSGPSSESRRADESDASRSLIVAPSGRNPAQRPVAMGGVGNLLTASQAGRKVSMLGAPRPGLVGAPNSAAVQSSSFSLN